MKTTHQEASCLFILEDESATIKLAQKLAGSISSALIMTFSGCPGAGKTTFIRALLRALGIKAPVKSPTFSLVESYTTPQGLPIHHFDLYRIHEPSELAYMGFRDYFSEPAICCLEWPEHAPDALKTVDLHFSWMVVGEGRHMQLQAKSELGKTILLLLKEEPCV